MTEAVPTPPDSSARRAQFLATEHWSLLATRSMSWNESFSRTSMFLTSLSTATVALALVGSATTFGPEFVTFALVVLSITLFLGVATFIRLSQVNNEDLYWVAGMNRLRGQYAKLEPGIEDEFVAGTTLDAKGFALTYGAMDVTGFSSIHFFVTTPGVIGIVCSVLAGVIAGLVTLQVAPSMNAAIWVGLVVSLIATALFIVYARRDASGYQARMIRFQDSKDTSARQRHDGADW
jgi:membrane protein implicated in regulation of membrane protease activity